MAGELGRVSRTFRVEYASGISEVERTLAAESKAIISWPSATGSTENRDRFQTNQVTVASVADHAARSGAGALGLSATWACVNLLAGTISSLPLMVYRTDRAGVREIARDHPLYYVLHDSPNYDQTCTDFWEYQVAGIELQGNAYATIEKRSDGSVYSLTPIRPDRVTASRTSSGAIEYRWNIDGREVKRLNTEVLHIRGPLGDALSGTSTLSACRGAFDSALSADDAAHNVFSNGVRPSGVLSADKALTPEQMDAAQARIEEKYAGAMRAGRPLILNNGLKWEQLSISPDDAQMLESRQFGIEEIARIFGVPTHMIGHTANSTSWGTGLEQQTLGFVKFSLRRRLKRIEQALEKQLLTPDDRAQGITIEFNLEGLLRGDSTGRASFYQSGLMNGWMTINEVRRLENMPPVDGGDTPRMQMQNVPITEAGQQPAGVTP